MSHPKKVVGSALIYNPTLIICSILLNIFALALPIFTLQIYDRVLPNAAGETLLLLATLLVLVLCLEGAMRSVRAALAGWAGARFEHATGCGAIDRLLGAELNAVESETAGTHLERLGAIDRLREFYANQGAVILIDLPFAIFFGVVIWFVGGPLSVVALSVFVLFGLVATLVGRALHIAVNARTESDRRRTSFMIEVLSGITTIKAMTMERLMMRRYERLMDTASTAAHRVTYISALSQALGGLFSNLAVVAVLAFGALMVMDRTLTIGQLACCSLLAGRVMQPLLRAMGIWTNFQAVDLAEQQIRKLYDLPQEPRRPADRLPVVQAGGIEFRDVTVDDGLGRPLLDRASLLVNPGETVGLIAPDGSDRSAVLALIAGLIRPVSGTIFYDGVPLQKTEPRPGADEVGLLPHHATVFQGSLIDNLTMFRRGKTVDRAVMLAERLGLDRYVASLANGYDTQISGGQTETLPGGVRQRIAIIRALVDDPRIILFDESNNSLDRDSNDRLLNLLSEMKGRATIFLVTYQPSVLRLADRVFELRDGQFLARPRPGETPPTLGSKAP